MNKENCFYLGKVTKPFGYKGELVLFLDVDEPLDYLDLDSVLIETNNGLIPYFIQSMNIKNNKATVLFDGVSPEDSQKLIGENLFLPMEMLPKLEGNKFYFHEIVNFSVVDEEKGNIGVIESVLDYPAQAIFQIKFHDKEILIPIIDEVIKKVDRENKTIYIKSPNGLVDLYLS